MPIRRALRSLAASSDSCPESRSSSPRAPLISSCASSLPNRSDRSRCRSSATWALLAKRSTSCSSISGSSRVSRSRRRFYCRKLSPCYLSISRLSSIHCRKSAFVSCMRSICFWWLARSICSSVVRPACSFSLAWRRSTCMRQACLAVSRQGRREAGCLLDGCQLTPDPRRIVLGRIRAGSHRRGHGPRRSYTLYGWAVQAAQEAVDACTDVGPDADAFALYLNVGGVISAVR